MSEYLKSVWEVDGTLVFKTPSQAVLDNCECTQYVDKHCLLLQEKEIVRLKSDNAKLLEYLTEISKHARDEGFDGVCGCMAAEALEKRNDDALRIDKDAEVVRLKKIVNVLRQGERCMTCKHANKFGMRGSLAICEQCRAQKTDWTPVFDEEKV